MRKQAFEAATIERYRHRKASIEDSLIEMHLADVPVYRVEDIIEALCGTRYSSGTVSKLNQMLYKHLVFVTDSYPEAHWKRCIALFYRNVFSHAPNATIKKVANIPKATHVQESLEAAQEKARAMVEQSITETLTYYLYPDTHWQRILTYNPLERIKRKIRRRTLVAGAFANGQSALMLCAARLRYITGTNGVLNAISPWRLYTNLIWRNN
jgi:transposase-like protein